MPPVQIQDVAEQGVMFVGFLQQPGGAPYFLGSWDPEDLSSLHSSPSPIHRHPFSTNTSPIDPAEPQHSDAEADCHPFEPQELDHESVEYIQQHWPSLPREPDFSPLKPIQLSEINPEESIEQIQTSHISLRESLESTNQPQDHIKLSEDAVQWCSNQNPVETQGNQLCLSTPETAGTIRRHQCGPPELKGSTDKHFKPPNWRERRDSCSDGWLSSPELDHNREKMLNSTCANRQSRVITYNNNNHMRLKNSEKDKNATSPPAQASKLQLLADFQINHDIKRLLVF